MSPYDRSNGGLQWRVVFESIATGREWEEYSRIINRAAAVSQAELKVRERSGLKTKGLRLLICKRVEWAYA